MRVLGQFLRNIIKSCCEVPIGSNCWNQSAFSLSLSLFAAWQTMWNQYAIYSTIYSVYIYTCIYILMGEFGFFAAYAPLLLHSIFTHSFHWLHAIFCYVANKCKAINQLKHATGIGFSFSSCFFLALSFSLFLACFSSCFISFFHCCAANAIDKRAREAKSLAYFCALSTSWVASCLKIIPY